MSLSDFDIGKELGKGSFSSVCIVIRKHDKKTYAMKRVKISMLSQKERENALNEIRILASLSHINIIGYKEAFFDDPSKTLNIVMEYADDGDLSGKIKYNLQNGLLFRETVIWDYLIQILNGLQYLHDNRIIHRDLKSANIFLTKDGTIKIGDLNVSKIAKKGLAFTQTGTPYFASPEIWQGKPYDYKSDIWGIGCIIYQMCQLRPPFRGKSFGDLSANILKGKYPPIAKFYSKDLAKILAMILKVEPKNRPSCEELIKSNIIKRKMKELQGENKEILNGFGKIGGEKANLIKTIKMPRNFKEINRALPMKRYNNLQREEMLENDEYETMKNGFFPKGEKNKEFNEKIDYYECEENEGRNNKKEIDEDYGYHNRNKKISNNYQIYNKNLSNKKEYPCKNHHNSVNQHGNAIDGNNINNHMCKNNNISPLSKQHSNKNLNLKRQNYYQYNQVIKNINNNINNNVIGRNVDKMNNKRPISSITPGRRPNVQATKKNQNNMQLNSNNNNNYNNRVIKPSSKNISNIHQRYRPITASSQISKKNMRYYNCKNNSPIKKEYKNQNNFKQRNGINIISNAKNNIPNNNEYKRPNKKRIIEKVNYKRGEHKIITKNEKAKNMKTKEKKI